MSTLAPITPTPNGYQVSFTRIFSHPIEKVWTAITDPQQLKYWFTDVAMDFREGGKLLIRFRDKAGSVSEGEILTIDPPHRFVWTWEGELAEWALERLDDQTTRLLFNYSRLTKAYALRAAAGFHLLVDRLMLRLDGSEATYAFGAEEKDPEGQQLQVHYAASVYATQPDLVDDAPLVVEKTVEASPERVWRALTDQQEMKQWYFTLDHFMAEEGFAFSFHGQGHKGENYLHRCVVTEVIPFKKLQYSWSYEGHAGYSLVTFELEDLGGRTTVRLSHYGLGSFPKHQDDFAKSSFSGGWNYLVGTSLPEFLAKGEPGL